IQVGMGRTGDLFAYQKSGVEPDIITLAKALGGGTAIGAFMVNDRANVLVPGEHGSTFGGNPLATAAGVAVMETLLADGFLDQAKATGLYLEQKLQVLVDKFSSAQEVRGRGLLQALVLN
ncbi:MAG: aminotransferase class III-fold pyridoxal phosphate-dependent enzyme, partial [Clostridiales bacterium]